MVLMRVLFKAALTRATSFKDIVFLEVYSEGSRFDYTYLREMDYLPCLRLLHWEEYPRKTLPLRFCQTNLMVELHNAVQPARETLWEGVQVSDHSMFLKGLMKVLFHHILMLLTFMSHSTTYKSQENGFYQGPII